MIKIIIETGFVDLKIRISKLPRKLTSLSLPSSPLSMNRMHQVKLNSRKTKKKRRKRKSKRKTQSSKATTMTSMKAKISSQRISRRIRKVTNKIIINKAIIMHCNMLNLKEKTFTSRCLLRLTM